MTSPWMENGPNEGLRWTVEMLNRQGGFTIRDDPVKRSSEDPSLTLTTFPTEAKLDTTRTGYSHRHKKPLHLL
jgi:hypothetical protein